MEMLKFAIMKREVVRRYLDIPWEDLREWKDESIAAEMDGRRRRALVEVVGYDPPLPQKLRRELRALDVKHHVRLKKLFGRAAKNAKKRAR